MNVCVSTHMQHLTVTIWTVRNWAASEKFIWAAQKQYQLKVDYYKVFILVLLYNALYISAPVCVSVLVYMMCMYTCAPWCTYKNREQLYVASSHLPPFHDSRDTTLVEMTRENLSWLGIIFKCKWTNWTHQFKDSLGEWLLQSCSEFVLFTKYLLLVQN